MDDARIEARRLDGAHGFHEALDLDLEIERFQAISRGEVGEAALQLKGAMEAYLMQELHHAIVVNADAVHARVDGKMVRSLQALSICRLSIGDGEFGSVYRRHDVVVQKQRNGLSRRLGKHQDRLAQTAVAQLDALIDRGNAQVGCACCRCCLGHFDGTVAVRIGLHHCQQTAVAAQLLFRLQHVVLDGTSVNLYPRPAPIVFGNRLHLFLGKGRCGRGGFCLLRLALFSTQERIERILGMFFGLIRKAGKAVR